jgi:hypothetical protein
MILILIAFVFGILIANALRGKGKRNNCDDHGTHGTGGKWALSLFDETPIMLTAEDLANVRSQLPNANYTLNLEPIQGTRCQRFTERWSDQPED